MKDLIPFLIILVFVISAIVKAVKKAAQGQGEGEGDGENYRAPEGDIQQFLRQLGMGPPVQQQQAAEPAPEEFHAPEAMNVLEMAEREEAEPTGPDIPANVVGEAAGYRQWQQPPAAPTIEPMPAAPRAPKAPSRAETAPTARPPLTRPPAGSLKRAVVWSEILGTPMALRAPGHEPPTGE